MHLFRSKKHENSNPNDLWAGLRLGQRSSLDTLFRRYYKSLYNYGVKLVSDKNIVDDAIQELFLKLWKQRNSVTQADEVVGVVRTAFL